MIEVCCGIIVNGARILAVQRGPESSHPWQWEFPGGKIHQGETFEQCVVREIEEELTIRIGNLNQLNPVDFDYGTKQIRLIPFSCRIISGKITLTEHVSLRWLGFDEWKTINWAEADLELILQNEKKLNSLLLDDKT